MRPLEIFLLLSTLIGLASILSKVPWRWCGMLALLAPVAMLLQALVEGARWQLAPCYLVAAGLAAAYLIGPRVRIPGWARSALAAVAIAAVILSAALAALLPVFSFPAPNGPYAVGTFTVQWTDTSRPDIFSENPSARRTLLAQVYYPAPVGARGPRAFYLPNAARVSAQLMAVLRLPGFLVSELRYVRTNAVEDAPPDPAASPMPVLIFLSGADGFRNSNYAQVQALASHGYAVVCLDQPGTAASVRLKDGRNVDAIPRALMQRLIDESVSADAPPPVMNGRVFPHGFITYLAQDAVFACHQLKQLNSHGLLAGRLDLQGVGVFGISLGGIEVPEACMADNEFRACLIMEGPMTTRTLGGNLTQPAMFITRRAEDMRAEGWSQAEIHRELNTMHQAFDQSRGDGYFIQIRGAFHANFSDAAFWSPLARTLGVTGPINGMRCEHIIEAYQLAFFNRYLRGIRSPLLAGPSAGYPEVLFKARR